MKKTNKQLQQEIAELKKQNEILDLLHKDTIKKWNTAIQKKEVWETEYNNKANEFNKVIDEIYEVLKEIKSNILLCKYSLSSGETSIILNCTERYIIDKISKFDEYDLPF